MEIADNADGGRLLCVIHEHSVLSCDCVHHAIGQGKGWVDGRRGEIEIWGPG